MYVFACGSVYSAYVNQWEPEVLLAVQLSTTGPSSQLSLCSFKQLNHQTS